MWINFPKNWTDCCSPSSFFSRNPLITDDHDVDKVPQNMGFDKSNHILFMRFMKSMHYLKFLSNKQKIDIFMKITPQGAIPSLKDILVDVFKCIRALNPEFMNTKFVMDNKPYDTRSGSTISRNRVKTI